MSRIVSVSCAIPALAIALAAQPALAQSAAPQARTETSNGGDEIVVTGRAGNSEQRKVETSYAISTINEETLAMKSPRGVGEALKNVPGFWIESSAGETGGNVRVRGIPNDGYSTITLEEDGLTIQHDGGLGFLNADQAFRMDSTVERVEVVRGGPSSIFASNAPGATVNFITRKGGDELGGFLKLEGASYGSGRADGWIGGPIGDTPWRWLVGGFYTLSDGQRHTGYTQDKGGQIRGTVNGDFDWGSIMVGVKRIDQKVGYQQVTPFVSDEDGNPTGVPGFDALTDTIAGTDSRYFTFRNADGTTTDFDAGVGTTVKLTQLTGEVKLNLGEGFTFQNNMRYRDSWTKRNSVTPYSVYDQGDLLSALSAYAPAYGGSSVGYVYTDNPGTVVDMQGANGNSLVLVNLVRSFTLPEKEFVNDGRFQKTAYIFGQKHDFALGGYFAHVSEEYHANSATALSDVRDNARLLDVYVLDAAGNPMSALTENGVLSYGAEYVNGSGTSDTFAIYGSDEWQVTDKLRLDGGVRWEHVSVDGRVEGRTSTNLGQSDTVADDSVLVGTGVYTPFKRSFDHTGWTIGANYQFTRDFGLFARQTAAFRLPSVGDFISNANADPVTQKMDFTEAGLKFAHRRFSAYLTGFRSIYHSYAISDYKLVDGKYVGQTVYGDTDTWGVELEATWKPVSWFDLHGQYTWRDPRFSKFVYTNSSGTQVDYSDNMLIRVPHNSFRVSPGFNFLQDKLRLEADVSYYGKRYSDVANQVELPAYTTLDLYARFDATDRLSFNLYVDNVTNTIGLTQGNPRAGAIENDEAGDATYLARSIFGRSVRGSVSFRF
ncbi:TonB-dependent receptor [Novosphingobium profundi]|uniref:TonB-dependent receptor n=1 Tax=Novosphingobium profundi TaxID=1774954 RepID=UPI001BDAAFE7|nr:TonB-dependent receptor [Novosphingobium profundi]MBT0670098.1 TonB-dependent receptor [Novosphingobium profundi]